MEKKFYVFFDKDNFGRWMYLDKYLEGLYFADAFWEFPPRYAELVFGNPVEEGFEWFSLVVLDDEGGLFNIYHNVNPNEPLSEDIEEFYIKCRLCVECEVDKDEDGNDIFYPSVECHKIK